MNMSYFIVTSISKDLTIYLTLMSSHGKQNNNYILNLSNTYAYKFQFQQQVNIINLVLVKLE